MLIFKFVLCNASYDAANGETVYRKLKIIQTLEIKIVSAFFNKRLDPLTPACLSMNIKCPKCSLVNFADAEKCRRCEFVFDGSEIIPIQKIVSRCPQNTVFASIAKRAVICVFVCLLTVFIFYLSLIFTAEPLSADERQTVAKAIEVLENKGFDREVFYLKHLTVFRANDNWFNASMINETAYAATNFPFEVVAIYPGFFTIPKDDTERAMVLLHEAQHLQGKDEKQAYEFVWKNRKQLGWTKDKYGNSLLWRNVRKQTKDYAPNLFICDFNEYGDCTE